MTKSTEPLLFQRHQFSSCCKYLWNTYWLWNITSYNSKWLHDHAPYLQPSMKCTDLNFVEPLLKCTYSCRIMLQIDSCRQFVLASLQRISDQFPGLILQYNQLVFTILAIIFFKQPVRLAWSSRTRASNSSYWPRHSTSHRICYGCRMYRVLQDGQ